MKVLLILLLLCSFGFAQQAQLDKDVIDIDVLAGLSTYSFDGHLEIFKSPLAVGLKYKGLDPDIDVGLYLSPVISIGDTDESSLSVMLYTSIYKNLGAGLGYRFWEFDIGLVKPTKARLYLSFNFSLLEGE